MPSGGGSSIVEDRLTFHLDPGNTNSYSGTGTTWTDMITNTNGTIPATWTYNSTNGGTFSTGTAAGPNYGFNSTWHPESSGAYQDEISYEAWVSFDNVSDVYNGIITTADSSSDLGMSLVTNNGGKFSGMIQGNSYSYVRYKYMGWLDNGINAPNVNDKWYHIVVASDNTDYKYYVNNVEGASTTDGHTNTSIASLDQTLGIGRFYPDSTSASFSLRGRFGPVRIYRKKLSADEVNQNYEAEKARFGY